jgi:hypothetical protein
MTNKCPGTKICPNGGAADKRDFGRSVACKKNILIF